MSSDPKINSLLDEANRLFLKGKLQEAISYYDKILEENPTHLGSLNNKGYALSKLKNYDSAIGCYDLALKIDSKDLPVLINKISALRKKGNLDEALSQCNSILESNPNYNVVLYHKERILLSMRNFQESITCCNKILIDYPNNGDVPMMNMKGADAGDPGDYAYSQLNGADPKTDKICEVSVGRIPVYSKDYTTLNNILDKTIKYQETKNKNEASLK